MIDSTNYDDKFRIYALANPAAIAQEGDFIRDAVLRTLQVTLSGQQQFSISESSGWINYFSSDEVWERKYPPSLPKAEIAIKTAEAFLVDLEQVCSPANSKWPKKLQGISLLPPVGLLRKASFAGVARLDGEGWDHWLYRAEPQLYVDGGIQKKVSVFGSQIELRIGHLGQIVSFRSRWRPLSGERVLAEASMASADQQDAAKTPEPKYLLEGDGIPQFYLAPYYFSENGGDFEVSSACSWALTADIGKIEQTSTEMTLLALAQGGSGKYSYNWAVQSLLNWKDNFIEFGSGNSLPMDTREGSAIGSRIQLKNGHYLVFLNIRDEKTGAFKHHQQQVFSTVFGVADLKNMNVS